MRDLSFERHHEKKRHRGPHIADTGFKMLKKQVSRDRKRKHEEVLRAREATHDDSEGAGDAENQSEMEHLTRNWNGAVS